MDIIDLVCEGMDSVELIDRLNRLALLDEAVNDDLAYLIFNATPSSTLEDVKNEYKKLVMLAHPDRGGSHGLMAAINRAYDLIKTKVKQGYQSKPASPPSPSKPAEPYRSRTPGWDDKAPPPRQEPPKTDPRQPGYKPPPGASSGPQASSGSSTRQRAQKRTYAGIPYPSDYGTWNDSTRQAWLRAVGKYKQAKARGDDESASVHLRYLRNMGTQI
jgi:curved DNA-binding protein CbpA